MEQKSYKIIWERWLLLTWHGRKVNVDIRWSFTMWQITISCLKIGSKKGSSREKKVEKWPWNIIAQSLSMSPCGNFRWIIQQKVPGTENHREKVFLLLSFFPYFSFHRYDWIARHVFLSLINLKVRKSTFLILWSSNAKTEEGKIQTFVFPTHIWKSFLFIVLLEREQ